LQASRTLHFLALLTYLGFLLYGSLLPFDFSSISFAEAWQTFWGSRRAIFHVQSSADFVSNALLGIPLGVLALGTLRYRGSSLVQALHIPIVLVFVLGFSLLLEFLQMFTPGRVSSFNDLFAQFTGALLGCVFWLFMSPGLERFFEVVSIRFRESRIGLLHVIIGLYLLALFVIGLLPLDVTISPGELWDKWKQGRILLFPFESGYDGRARFGWRLVLALFQWLPIAMYGFFFLAGSFGLVMFAVLGLASVLEGARLFVFSATVDTTNLFAAVAAVLVAALIKRLVLPIEKTHEKVRLPVVHPHYLAHLGVAGVWTIVVCLVFWHPYDFELSRSLIASGLSELRLMPFYHHTISDPATAVIDIGQNTVLFAPFGVHLWFISRRWQDTAWYRPMVFAGLLLIAGISGVVEGGQLLLKSRLADITDWLLQTAGATLAFTLLKNR